MKQERMLILEMVDEGRITPEEALILLHALGGTHESEPIRIEWLAANADDEPHFAVPVSPVPLIARERVF